MVDAGKIGIMQAVDLSFLSEDAQQWVLVAIQDTNAVISKQQSAMLKESDKKGRTDFSNGAYASGERKASRA